MNYIKSGVVLALITCMMTGMSCSTVPKKSVVPDTQGITTQEEILNWHSDIEVTVDGSMVVSETIKVLAKSIYIKRGIYRDFPTIYIDRKGNIDKVAFKILSVKRDGKPEPHHTEAMNNSVRLYIGDKNVYLTPDIYTYLITYSTNKSIGFFEEYDELYWNVTGNGWGFPILKASAAVILPSSVPAESVRTDGYTGPEGSREKAFTSKVDESGRVVFESTRPLAPREGLTIVVRWAKGHFNPFTIPKIQADLQRGLYAYVAGEYETAYRVLFPIAKEGEAWAQNVLGSMFYYGQGVHQDYSEAVNWSQKAAEQGLAEAQNVLGIMYAKGEGVPQDYVKAVKWYREAAEQGLAVAQHNLGLMSQDDTEAVKWFLKAAEQGLPEAQTRLAECYFEGWGIPRDYVEAVKWCYKAAVQGYSKAQSSLGWMYELGTGVPQDFAEARNWYHKAAEQGFVPAQCALGDLYLSGEGGPEDYVLAYMWFNIAGNLTELNYYQEIARKNLGLCAEKMIPDQLAEAKKMSEEWLIKFREQEK